MTSPASRRVPRLRRAAMVYLAFAFIGTGAIAAAVAAGALPRAALLLWMLYLGPLGVLSAAVIGTSGLAVIAPPAWAPVLALVAAILFTAVAALNVLALRGLRRAGARRVLEGAGPQHRVAEGVLFSFAGAAFVLLSVFSGFLFLVAYGVDVPTADPVRIRLQTVSAIGWLLGLFVAVAGLIVWIRGVRTGRSSRRWAGVDLAVLLLLNAAVVVNGSI